MHLEHLFSGWTFSRLWLLSNFLVKIWSLKFSIPLNFSIPDLLHFFTYFPSYSFIILLSKSLSFLLSWGFFLFFFFAFFLKGCWYQQLGEDQKQARDEENILLLFWRPPKSLYRYWKQKFRTGLNNRDFRLIKWFKFLIILKIEIWGNDYVSIFKIFKLYSNLSNSKCNHKEFRNKIQLLAVSLFLILKFEICKNVKP